MLKFAENMMRKQRDQDFIRRNFFAEIQTTVTDTVNRNFPNLVWGRDSVYFTVIYTPKSKDTLPETGGTAISKPGGYDGEFQFEISNTDLSQYYKLR